MLKQAARGPNWRHVGVFLGLTFGLTWLLNLAMHLRGGLDNAGVVTALQFQMLLPACSAILLGLRWFPESPLYHWRTSRSKPGTTSGFDSPARQRGVAQGAPTASIPLWSAP